MKTDVYNLDNLLGMSRYPDKHFDLALCDVPYGTGEARKHASRIRPVLQKNGSRLPVSVVHKPKDWDDRQPPQEFFDEVFRVAKKQIIFGSNYIQFSQKDSSSGRIFWDKVNGKSDFSDGELLWTNLFSSVRKVTFMWAGFCQGISLEQPTRQRGNKKLNEKRIHPSQKPLALYQWIFKNFVQKDWRILDTHLGSGSSRIVAAEHGIEFVGFESDKEYFNAHEARFADYLKTKESALF